MTAKTPDLIDLVKPTTCALVKDETPESEEAERLLREAGIPLIVIPPGHWGKRKLELQTEEHGIIRWGIQGVEAYIAALRIRARSLKRAGEVPEQGSVSGPI